MAIRVEPWLLGLLLSVACADEERRYELVDRLDVEFALETKGMDYDFEAALATPEPCNGGRPGWGTAWERALELCSACIDGDAGSYAPKHDCRVTVCATDDDCPQFGTWSFVCDSGVCQDVELVDEPTVSHSLATVLCAAEIPRGPAEDFVLGANPELDARLDALDCDDETRECNLPLPEGCLQIGG